MPVSQEYQVGSLTLHKHVKFTYLIGLIPIVLSTCYLWYERGVANLMMWLTVGICLGLELMIWGGYEVLFHKKLTTRWARYFQEHGPFLFPVFLLTARFIMFSMGFVVIWKAAREMGFPITPWMTISFFALLAVMPIHRTLQGLVVEGESKGWDIITDFVRLIHTNTVMLFVMAFITSGQAAEEGGGSDGINIGSVFLWMIPVLTVISTLILFVDRILNYEARNRR